MRSLRAVGKMEAASIEKSLFLWWMYSLMMCPWSSGVRLLCWWGRWPPRTLGPYSIHPPTADSRGFQVQNSDGADLTGCVHPNSTELISSTTAVPGHVPASLRMWSTRSYNRKGLAIRAVTMNMRSGLVMRSSSFSQRVRQESSIQRNGMPDRPCYKLVRTLQNAHSAYTRGSSCDSIMSAMCFG
jgi:hypothetical protein